MEYFSDLYNVMYLIFNIFGTYIIYRYMGIFFYDSNVNRRLELFSYISYYIIISAAHLLISDSYLNLILNLFLFFFISLNYDSSLKKKMFVSLLIYAILLAIESFIVILIYLLNFCNESFRTIMALLSVKIISLIMALVCNNVRYVKNDFKIPFYKWFSILFFPIGSLVLFYIIISEPNKYNILIALIILLLFNSLIFYIYEIMNREYQKDIEFRQKEKEAELLMQKSIQYERQLEVMNTFQEKIRMIKHNYNNDLIILDSLIRKNNSEDAVKYIEDMKVESLSSGMYVNTGNIAVDSLLNYKLATAEKIGAQIKIKVKIPTTLKILNNDMSIILGCLLDNAIEALAKVEDKLMGIDIGYDRNIIYISVYNSYVGDLFVENNNYITTKTDKESHGLGLASVKFIVDKYNGEMIITPLNGLFLVDIMLYEG